MTARVVVLLGRALGGVCWRAAAAAVAERRDRFWRAFWVRQRRFMPPTVAATVKNCSFSIMEGAPEGATSVRFDQTGTIEITNCSFVDASPRRGMDIIEFGDRS